MRIIAGEFGGRKIKTPKNNDIRPTMDRAKEGVFSSLGYFVVDATVLDLFAGTGNLGIEAISRGADMATFVDASSESIGLVKENLDTLNIKAEVIKSDVYNYVNTTSETFDLIFMDPPYDCDFEYVYKILDTIIDNKLLNENGKIVFEFDKKNKIDLSKYNLLKTKKYGISNFYTIGEL